jgi:leishmanolysin
MQNMENYISRMLRVDREQSKISFTSVRDIPTAKVSYTADLVIALTVRPFPVEGKVLAAAFPWTYSAKGGRPLIGGIYVNPAYVPDEVQNEKSFERFFFTVVFHEIMHVLGMTSGLWRSWIDKSTGKPYKQPTASYENPKYPGKKFELVTTPAIQKFILDRFGITEMMPGVPTGMEIEDGGGGGTAGSHPESRVYLSEVMCGIFVGYVTISGLSLAILDDTGWYEVNYSLAEPHPWGSGASLGAAPLTSFLNTAPQIAYPKHYLCWEKDAKHHCNFDFLSKAYCSPVTDFKCPGVSSDDKKACVMRNFVNPMELPIRGSREEFDFLYFTVGNVSERCGDIGIAGTPDEAYGPSSMCAMSTLSQGRELEEALPRCYVMDCTKGLEITVGKETRTCRVANEKLTFAGFTGAVICPDPRLICGMKSYLGSEPYSGPEPVEPDADEKFARYIRFLAGLSLFGVFLCFLSLTLIYYLNKWRGKGPGEPGSRVGLSQMDGESVDASVNDVDVREVLRP